jgi:CelD/BcsL family acetyltransferase involved in cellulose biosynthesis
MPIIETFSDSSRGTWTGVPGRSASAPAIPRPGIFDILDLMAVPQEAWADLAARAAEPNAFYHPVWARAVAGRTSEHGVRALLAWDGPARTRLIGLLPVVSAWRSLRLPLPVLVAWQAYAPLTTPLLDRDMTDIAARALVAAARKAGAVALLMPALAEEGPSAAALRGALAEFKGAPVAFNRHQRALLDATQDSDTAIQSSLGAKKVKELRRQRNRLADDGEVAFKLAAPGPETAAALDAFLKLEASGWKGITGTALAQSEGDAAFIRNAVPDLVASGAAQVATLSSGEHVVAAGVLLRHLRRGYFFKIAYDESAAKTSPGVQITLDITRQLCADGAIDSVDSIAISNHPMIDKIWRGRLAVGDLIVPAGKGGALLSACVGLILARNALRQSAKKLYHRLRSITSSAR